MTEAAEVQEVTEEESVDKEAWDKDKQALDFERANARKAREELESLSEVYQSQSERLESLEKELGELKSSSQSYREMLEREKQAEQDKLDEMDPDLVDPSVSKNIKRLEALLREQADKYDSERKALKEEIGLLKEKASGYETERQQLKAKEYHSRVVNSILSEVEDSMKAQGVDSPGKFRSDALKLADDLVDSGKEKRPNRERDGESQSVLDAIRLMKKCYLEVKSRHEKKSKGVSVDGGGSGVEPSVKSDEIKPGSLAEVKAQMAKNKSWKGT